VASGNCTDHAMKEHEGVEVLLHSILNLGSRRRCEPSCILCIWNWKVDNILHLPGNEAQFFSALQPAAASHYTQHCRQANDRMEYGVRASAPGEPGTNCLSYFLLTRHPKCLTPPSWVMLRFYLAMLTGNVLENPLTSL